MTQTTPVASRGTDQYSVRTPTPMYGANNSKNNMSLSTVNQMNSSVSSSTASATFSNQRQNISMQNQNKFTYHRPAQSNPVSRPTGVNSGNSHGNPSTGPQGKQQTMGATNNTGTADLWQDGELTLFT